MSTDYAPAVWLGNGQIGYGGWGFFTPRWIVVHGTAGDATIEAVQRTFMNKPPSDKSSTHYAVGQDGRVGQYVPESEAAWGNGPITGPSGHAVAGAGNAHDSWWDGKGNANPYTFSIEHCKPDIHNASALTPAQTAASFALIDYLCEKYGIPKRVYGTATPPDANGGVIGHFSMDPQERASCPGNYPWQELQDYLDGKSGYGGGGGMWTDAPDGGGTDDKGNHAGAGLNAARKQRDVTADSYNGEVYVGGAQTFRSFIAYTSGEICLWDGNAAVWDGARVASELLRRLNVERSKPAPEPVQAPIPPEYVAAKAAVDALKAAGL